MNLSLAYSVADQSFTQTRSLGILNLSLGLLEHLAKRPEISALTVLGNHTLRDRLVLPASTRVVEYNRAIGARWRRVLWDQLGVYRAARRTGRDWLFLPKGFASFLRPCPLRLITCVADVMQDYYARRYPGVLPWAENVYFHRAFAASVRFSQIVFTISDFTTSEVNRVARAFPWRSAPVRTIGIGFSRVSPWSSTKQDRVVVLAGRWPHKRTDLARDYLRRWQTQTGYAGSLDWIGGWPPTLAWPDHTNWRRHERVAETEYRQLLQDARALVYFSDYEGFGMPPVEAALAGTCPVYSEIPATREVMEGIGAPFPNDDYKAFARALNTALGTSPEVLEAWAATLLARHHWDRVVDRVFRGLAECQQEGTAGRGPAGASLEVT
jgi:glycosyltransferase involved in cell wall biosynthesis